MKDAIILAIAIFTGAAWGWLIKEAFQSRNVGQPTKPGISSGRLTNLLLALILGLLVGWFVVNMTGCTVDEDGLLPPPDDRCSGITLEACLPQVTIIDGGADR